VDKFVLRNGVFLFLSYFGTWFAWHGQNLKQKKMHELNRTYKVVVKDSANKTQALHSFESLENALICFNEFLKRYSHYQSITIKAIQK
jgi:hypothetical protein